MSKIHEVKNILVQQPKRWLVTGAAGFIGSHITYQLLKLNQQVVGLDNFLTGSKDNLNDLKSQLPSHQWKNFKFVEADIRNPQTYKQILKGIDHVCHHAALAPVLQSIEDPLTTHDHNINGFIHILTQAKEAGVKSFVYASSSAVYGDDPQLPKIESQTGQPLSPYAVTKLCNELYAQVFYKNFNLPVIGLRYFNVFGPRQDPNGAYAAVIPLWISALIKNEVVYINGDGTTTRDFCYIENVVDANILAATCEDPKAYGETFNIACGQKTSLQELYEILKSKLQMHFSHVKFHKPTHREFRPGDIRHSVADIQKASSVLGYHPRFSVAEGLDAALSWYIKEFLAQERKSA